MGHIPALNDLLHIPYFLKMSPRRYLISGCSTMRRQFEGGIYRDRYTCTYTVSIMSLFVCTYNARAHTYIVVDPVPCGEISRAAFIGMCWLKYASRFRGNTIHDKNICWPLPSNQSFCSQITGYQTPDPIIGYRPMMKGGHGQQNIVTTL